MIAPLIIAPEPWSAAAAAMLCKAARDELLGVETIRQQVKAGAVLYVSRVGGNPVFVHVVKVLELENGREAVVLASSGVALTGVHLSKIMLADIERRYSMCERIRVTASRRGMEKILNGQGFERQSVNYIKRIRGAAHVL